jgi:hypothetical protein
LLGVASGGNWALSNAAALIARSAGPYSLSEHSAEHTRILSLSLAYHIP